MTAVEVVEPLFDAALTRMGKKREEEAKHVEVDATVAFRTVAIAQLLRAVLVRTLSVLRVFR